MAVFLQVVAWLSEGSRNAPLSIVRQIAPCYFFCVMASEFDQVFEALTRASVRFVVVGGVAVVLQGYPRWTADLDLVVALDRENVLSAIRALTTLGYRPRAPVPAEEFADPEKRREWMEDKGLKVFSLWSSRLPGTEIDLFVTEPFPFDAMQRRARKVRLGTSEVAVASVEDLILMKERAGRPMDLLDVAALRKIQSERGGTG